VLAFWLVDGEMSQLGGRHPEHVVQAEAQAALRQMTNGYWVTQIIYVAARLGIADLLATGRGPSTCWRSPPEHTNRRCTA
jgi:hypothetical protein